MAGLTAREIEVLVLLARGASSKQIATELVITPKTARNHVEHIYAKIGASSRAAAAHVRDAARPAPRGRDRRPGPVTATARPCSRQCQAGPSVSGWARR